MRHYLKFSYSLALIGLLGTSCQKEALVVPAQSVSVPTLSRTGQPFSPAPKPPPGASADNTGSARTTPYVRGNGSQFQRLTPSSGGGSRSPHPSQSNMQISTNGATQSQRPGASEGSSGYGSMMPNNGNRQPTRYNPHPGGILIPNGPANGAANRVARSNDVIGSSQRPNGSASSNAGTGQPQGPRLIPNGPSRNNTVNPQSPNSSAGNGGPSQEIPYQNVFGPFPNQ